MPSTLQNLNAIADLVRADPGLPANIYAADITEGAAAAELMNGVIVSAMNATGVNADGIITPDDAEAISDYIRATPALYAEFVVGHGDDEGSEETGFHLVQSDGGAFRFQGRDFIDTVADAIYHIGFEYRDGRFLNEDGNENETVADVAGWLNYFANGENSVFGTDQDESLGSGQYSFALYDARDETFYGYGGDDRIWAGDGDDTVWGGSGDDRSGGDVGDDVIMGEDGNDSLWGEEGDDHIDGGGQHDNLGGGEGNDMVLGGRGNDKLNGDEGNDTLSGGAGRDTLYGSDGRDSLMGGSGQDKLFGGMGYDTLYGNAGNDEMFGEGGADSMFGNGGHDSMYGNEGGDYMHGGSHDDRIYGGDGDDSLYGASGNDSMRGDDGDDLLDGSIGDDSLSGGEGDDTMNGGTGADYFYSWEMAAGRDVFVFAPGDSGMTGATRDVVEGFRSGEDMIDLTAFTGLDWRGSAGFTGSGPEARYNGTFLQIDSDGDGAFDMMIEFKWVSAISSDDLILA